MSNYRNPVDGSLVPYTPPVNGEPLTTSTDKSIVIRDTETGTPASVNDEGQLSVSIEGNPSHNAVEVIQTTVSTTPVRINFPDEIKDIIVRYIDTETVWIGSTSSITAGSPTTFPMVNGDLLEISLDEGNDNSLYAVVSSGTITLYAMGTVAQ